MRTGGGKQGLSHLRVCRVGASGSPMTPTHGRPPRSVLCLTAGLQAWLQHRRPGSFTSGVGIRPFLYPHLYQALGQVSWVQRWINTSRLLPLGALHSSRGERQPPTQITNTQH